MFVNALAVSERHRCRGVGARLHAWADNSTALNFCKARGFVQLAVAEIPYDARLRHVGSCSGSCSSSTPHRCQRAQTSNCRRRLEHGWETRRGGCEVAREDNLLEELREEIRALSDALMETKL
jgi:hypothetical protein